MSQQIRRNPQHHAIDSPSCDTAVSRRAAIQAAFAAAGAAVLFGLPRLAGAEPQASQETTDKLNNAQAQLEDAQEQLDEISSQFEDLSRQLDDTLGQIETLQGQIDTTQANIDQIEQDISDTQDDIDLKQAQLDRKQEVLATRVTSSYKTGKTGILSLLLSSDSFDELVSKLHYVDKINASDQEAIEEIHAIQDALEQQKALLEQQKEELEQQMAELEQQMAELEQLKSQQTQQLDDMKAKKDEVQQLLDSLSQDVKDLIAQRDAEILAAAQAEEEARRAAEEAARQGATSIPGDGQSAIAAGTAQQRVVDSAYSTPSPGAGLCAGWVSMVFANAGFGSVPGNADDQYANWCTSSSKSNLKVGMIIAVPSHPHTSAGRIYGHVGVYVGDNTVRDNVGYIRSIDVDQWISYYGPTSTPRWGWANGINLEG